jgi:hypothetical protein
VAAFEAVSGLRGVIHDFWVLPGALDLGYRPSGGPNQLINAIREVAPEEEFAYLNPLPFSRLQ